MLFAALTLAFGSGSRFGATSTEEENAGIMAGEILEFASAVKAATDRLMASGRCNEFQISFENDVSKNKNGTFVVPFGSQTTTDACRVFKPNGGGIQMRTFTGPYFPTIADADRPPGQDYLAGNPVVVLVDGVYAGSGELDLALKIPYMTPALCAALNKKMDIPGNTSNYLPINNDYGSKPFAGDYTPLFGGAGTLANVDFTLRAKTAFCAKYLAGPPSDYSFFYLIHVR